ncbi:hypothetical protein [Sphingobium sp. RAC03]|uniref:hypothetical protein n=1 Tax=Sphingobium sp. RAC03 TaxID=1843368 RepID=UPI0012374F85|nr:hypothetical protein [Sphingobium sp. RAC03]
MESTIPAGWRLATESRRQQRELRVIEAMATQIGFCLLGQSVREAKQYGATPQRFAPRIVQCRDLLRAGQPARNRARPVRNAHQAPAVVLHQDEHLAFLDPEQAIGRCRLVARLGNVCTGGMFKRKKAQGV